MRVEFTERGDRAFDELLLFLITEQEVPEEKVRDIKEGIKRRAFELENFPDRGRPEEDLSERHGRTYQSVLAEDHYRIVHFVDRSKGVVWITDVFDTRQHPSKMQG